jgi:hypothetical protein
MSYIPVYQHFSIKRINVTDIQCIIITNFIELSIEKTYRYMFHVFYFFQTVQKTMVLYFETTKFYQKNNNK